MKYSPEFRFWCAAIAGLVFLLHATVRGRIRIARRDLPAVGAFALLGVTVFYWAYFRAVELGGAALAAILLYTAPAWVALASALLLGERLTMRKSAAVALTLAGIALAAFGSGSRVSSGAGNAASRVSALACRLLSAIVPTYGAYLLLQLRPRAHRGHARRHRGDVGAGGGSARIRGLG